MAYVIAAPCVGVKDAACVRVCPVDCIHSVPDASQYYIDPDECIDCAACEPVCPVEAIFEERELPARWADYAERNARFFQQSGR